MSKLSARMHPHIVPYPAKGFGAKQAINEPAAGHSIKSLVSKIKRLITLAKMNAIEEEKNGNQFRMNNLRIAAAFAEQRLRDVVDGKVDHFKSSEEFVLKDGIGVLEDAMARSARL